MQGYVCNGPYGRDKTDRAVALGAVIDFVCENFDQDIDLEALAALVGVSKAHLCRRFSRSFGFSLMGWIWKVRIRLAQNVLQASPSVRLTDVAFSCGFNSSAHFSRSYRKEFDAPPSRHLQRRSQTTRSLSPTSLREFCRDAVRNLVSNDLGLTVC